MDFSQTLFGNLHTMLPGPWAEMVSILMAFVCGAIVGFEREKGHKPAGLRTQMLICLGSAILTIVSMSPVLGGHEPARIAAQIVTGVGFLGAGTILHDRAQIKGLTTAATIWTVSGIGIVVGAGYVAAGLCLSLSVLLVLGVFRRVESHVDGQCGNAHVTVLYRPEKGKTRALIVGRLDEARGPHCIEDESVRGDGVYLLRLSYCDRHPEHRAVVAELAAMAAVEALEVDKPG